MSSLAVTHLRQARCFLREGDCERAAELLDKARVLAREDRVLLREILADLATACDSLGRCEQASRCREQLSRLEAPEDLAPLAPGRAAAPPGVTRVVRRGASRLAWGLIAMLGATTAACAIAIGWLLIRPPRIVTVVEHRLVEFAPATLPATRPATTQTVAAVVMPAANPVPPTTFPAATTAWDRQQLLKDNVGMVVVMLRYEGRVQGQQIRIDVPLGAGTAFAVNEGGIMLTNKHVVEAASDPDVPVTLEEAGLPTVTLRTTSYLVCFGAGVKEHFPAKLLHKSPAYDLAVLQVSRQFTNPLALSNMPLRQGDDVLVCGFPGAVVQALNQAASTPGRVLDVSRRWRQTGHVNPMDHFSPDSFNSTLTKGIVSAPERHVRGVGYLQMDASISPGSSGGPVMNAQNQVVGIATFGLRSEAGLSANYNFAMLVDQLHAELAQYLKR